MNGFTPEEFERMADPTIGAADLDRVTPPYVDYCPSCLMTRPCLCRPGEPRDAVSALRAIVEASNALPFGSAVPLDLLRRINAAEDYLRRHHPED